MTITLKANELTGNSDYINALEIAIKNSSRFNCNPFEGEVEISNYSSTTVWKTTEEILERCDFDKIRINGIDIKDL